MTVDHHHRYLSSVNTSAIVTYVCVYTFLKFFSSNNKHFRRALNTKKFFCFTFAPSNMIFGLFSFRLDRRWINTFLSMFILDRTNASG